jgi:hypothetical protein
MLSNIERVFALKKQMVIRARQERGRPEIEKRIIDGLNGHLRKMELKGEVCSVLVFNKHGKISCRIGRQIADGVLFHELNLSIGTKGTKITGRISHSTTRRKRLYDRGFFVPADEFGVDCSNDKFWVVLVGIPVCPCSVGVSFPRIKPGV